ncbi:hypothetical protein M408DRAFT_29554 [Serendipita vermifera MAFF 305830]|uniref:Uncharacterized protein n=1 Tax=Serendipita vermifera MAFF 305830 TaxID=933852 RepID=A0A0C3AA18_SERVB|nr:hypothetical protein M408DRAFT_29554 [Serendipita vermifera MAFF 305830]
MLVIAFTCGRRTNSPQYASSNASLADEPPSEGEAPDGLSESGSVHEDRAPFPGGKGTLSNAGMKPHHSAQTSIAFSPILADQNEDFRTDEEDAQWKPTAALTTQEILELTKAFDISNEYFKVFFEGLCIPCSMERIERIVRKAGNHKVVEHHTASTVTIDILEEVGWRFIDTGEFLGMSEDESKTSLKGEEIYNAPQVQEEYLPMTDLPQYGTDGLNTSVHKALNRLKQKIEAGLVLRLPTCWFTRLVYDWSQYTPLRAALKASEEEGPAEKETEAIPARQTTPQRARRQSTASNQDSLIERLASNSPESSEGEKQDDEESGSDPSVSMRQDEIALRERIVHGLISHYGLGGSLQDEERLEELLKWEDQYFMHLSSLCHRVGMMKPNRTSRWDSIRLTGGVEPIWDIKKDSAPDRQLRRTELARLAYEWARFIPITRDIQLHRSVSGQLKGQLKGKKKAERFKFPEIVVEEKVGSLILGVFGDVNLMESKNVATKFIDPLRHFGTNPKPDYAARVSGENWNHWPTLMSPIIVSGECKPASEVNDSTEAQLAMNSTAIMVLFTMMYLSTRTSASEDIPPWMFTTSLVYTEEGFAIYAHYPEFTRSHEWNFVSALLSKHFVGVWTDETSDQDRMRGLAALLKLRLHAQFVTERLLDWSRSPPASAAPIVAELIARAHLDMKNYTWFGATRGDKASSSTAEGVAGLWD